MHAPRIVNDVSCVTRINHGIHFAWQAQYLLRLEVDFPDLPIDPCFIRPLFDKGLFLQKNRGFFLEK